MALIINTLNQFFNKQCYDFEKDDINLHDFHPQLRMVLAINGIFFTNPHSILRLAIPALCSSVALTGLFFEVSFVIRGLIMKDYGSSAESFCYVMILGTIPTILASFIYNADNIRVFLDNINSDFKYVCKLGGVHRKKFLEGQLLIWKACYGWLGMGSVTGVLYIANTVVLLLYHSLFKTDDEHATRPLIFPMWLPYDDPYRSPNFEIFLVLQIQICVMVVTVFCVYVYTLSHYLLHYYTMMDMIMLDFETLFVGLDDSVATLPPEHPAWAEMQSIFRRRMKRIVEWHNDVFKALRLIAQFYGPPLVYQVIFTSFGICIMAFQIADQLDKGKFDFLFTALCVCSIIQLWIPCYLGTLIRDKGVAVGEASWNCNWQTTPLSRLLRKDITIIIMRSQRPLLIEFPCLPTLELETFSSIMSSSFSYFNMMRNGI